MLTTVRLQEGAEQQPRHPTASTLHWGGVQEALKELYHIGQGEDADDTEEAGVLETAEPVLEQVDFLQVL